MTLIAAAMLLAKTGRTCLRNGGEAELARVAADADCFPELAGSHPSAASTAWATTSISTASSTRVGITNIDSYAHATNSTDLPAVTRGDSWYTRREARKK